jgi:hypothetical protein
VLFGLSIAVLSKGIAGETLLGLWGPALGATIGASATILAAIYYQRLIERRELRRPIGATLSKLEKVSYNLTLLAHRINSIESRSKKEVGLHDLAIKAVKDADRALAEIELEHALPSALSEKVNDHIANAIAVLHLEIRPRVQLAPIRSDADEMKALWAATSERTVAVRNHIDSAVAALSEYLR